MAGTRTTTPVRERLSPLTAWAVENTLPPHVPVHEFQCGRCFMIFPASLESAAKVPDELSVHGLVDLCADCRW